MSARSKWTPGRFHREQHRRPDLYPRTAAGPLGLTVTTPDIAKVEPRNIVVTVCGDPAAHDRAGEEGEETSQDQEGALEEVVPSRPGRSLAGWRGPALRSPIAPRRRRAAAARARRERAARADPRAARAGRAGGGARVSRGRRGAFAAGVRRHRAGDRADPAARRAAASGSRSTATTTSTGSAPRPCSCARCGGWGRTSTGTCPTAQRRLRAEPARRSSGSRSGARACS